MGNFGLIVAQHYISLYLRIFSKDNFETLQHDREQYIDKNFLNEISYGSAITQNYARLYLRIHSKTFQTLQHGRGAINRYKSRK